MLVASLRRRSDVDRDADRTRTDAGVLEADPFARELYWVLGVPIDRVGMREAADKLSAAMEGRSGLAFVTPNLNFLARAQSDELFQTSLVSSDFSLVDGIALFWVARLLGIPLHERVAGSDLFEVLKSGPRAGRRLTVFMFGGAQGVAESARSAINTESDALSCVGALNPGFVSIDEMSTEAIIAAINSSGADFLMVSLGAVKGQAWLMRNSTRLTIPVRAHLGATLNFQAKTSARAPVSVRRLGLEWLWRIKEEPHLWRRYASDAAVLLRLLFGRVVPLTLYRSFDRLISGDLSLEQINDAGTLRLRLSGSAVARHITLIRESFNQAIRTQKEVLLDMSAVRMIDARFLGALMILKMQLANRGGALQCVGLNRGLMKLFRLHGAVCLLESGHHAGRGPSQLR
jgi:N-acetylglucosaminyldiphosphoundecaprenol N-acetyl-beta-D-mannosaminyltransferase